MLGDILSACFTLQQDIQHGKIKNIIGKISFHCYALEGESKRSGKDKTKGEDISDKITNK